MQAVEQPARARGRRSRAGAGAAASTGRPRPGSASRPRPSPSRARAARRSARPDGQVRPRAVREQQVEVPERRRGLRAQRAQEGRVDAAGVVVLARVLEEVVPAVGDRRDPAGQVVGQQLVQVDDAGVLGERLRAVAERALEPRAERRRAEVRLVVDDVEGGGAAEEREQVLPVVGVDRELAGLREAAGQDRRDRVRRALADRASRARTRSSRAASRAKFGKRTGSMRPCASSSELSGSSSNAISTTGARGRSPAACAVCVESDSRETSELKRKRARKSSGAGAEHGQRPASPQARAGRARPRRRPSASRERDQQPAGSTRAADRLEHEQRHERRDEDRVDGPAAGCGPPARSSPSRTAGGTSRSTSAKTIASQRVEPRAAKNSPFLPSRSKSGCGDRERPQHEQVQAGQPPRQAPSPRHGLGVARYSVRVPEPSCSRRSTSNPSPSARSNASRP